MLGTHHIDNIDLQTNKLKLQFKSIITFKTYQTFQK